jgi:sugar-phosphatase
VAESYRVRAIVFDLDGVLVDSMPAIRGYWTDWAGRHGVAAETVLGALHLTAEELIRKFAPNLDASVEARATAVGQARIETGIVAFEGGKALIERLPQNGWAVVTSARRDLALRHLALGRLPVPDVLITAEDTPRGKPDPAGYLLAAERLGIPPSRCLAIEDSPAGVRAARSAGMHVVAVTTSHSATELDEADAVVISLASLRLRVDQQRKPMEVVVSCEAASRLGRS